MLADGRAAGGGGYDAAGLAMPGGHTAMGVDESDANPSRPLVPHLPAMTRVCARECVWGCVVVVD
jgi:hypothetical protein